MASSLNKPKKDRVYYYNIEEVPEEELDNVVYDEQGDPVITNAGNIRMKPGRPKGIKGKTPTKRKKGTRSPNGVGNGIYVPPGFSVFEAQSRCTCCGKSYVSPKSKFPKTHSPIYANNDYYVPICYSCLNKLYGKLRREKGLTDAEAMRNICQKLDVYYMDEALEIQGFMVDDPLSVDNRVGRYIQQVVSKERTGLKTYTDTQVEEKDWQRKMANASLIVGLDDDEAIKVKEATAKSRKLFGNAFNDVELNQMYDEYKDYLNRYKTLNAEQTNLVVTMCQAKVFKDRAAEKNQMREYGDANQMYINALKSFESLKTTVAKNDEVPTVGVSIETIEKYTPAEYYKDKKLFKDYDGLEKYVKGHIVRPIKNFFTGSQDKHPVYSVNIDDGEGEVDPDVK